MKKIIKMVRGLALPVSFADIKSYTSIPPNIYTSK